jgi:hypothetical protein
LPHTETRNGEKGYIHWKAAYFVGATEEEQENWLLAGKRMCDLPRFRSGSTGERELQNGPENGLLAGRRMSTPFNIKGEKERKKTGHRGLWYGLTSQFSALIRFAIRESRFGELDNPCDPGWEFLQARLARVSRVIP